MPHVEIKCYPGRTEEVKQKCADKVAADVAELSRVQPLFRIGRNQGSRERKLEGTGI